MGCVMEDATGERDPVEVLAEEFLERRRRGEMPTQHEYIARHPHLADAIRELFPALVLMDDIDPGASELSRPPSLATTFSVHQLGDYRIVREIGRGGMGVVYEAEQLSLGRRVALKVLSAQAIGDGKALERFRREARAAGKLHHTNIVPIFEVGQDGDTCYYAMQLIQGQNLDEVVDEVRRLRKGQGSSSGSPAAISQVTHSVLNDQFATSPLAAAAPGSASAVLYGSTDGSRVGADRRTYFRSVARIGHQTALALSHAHARGIVHRDIKPSNLLLDASGVVWVTDFGLAKTQEDGLSNPGELPGTLRYMSPERFRGECDARSDIYALGLTLYEMLVLRPGFETTDRLRLIEQIYQQEPARPLTLDPRIPVDLETIVLKAMEKDARGRYQSAEDMADDLRRFLADEPIRARRASWYERGWRWSRRNPAVAMLCAVTVALLLALSIGSVLAAIRIDGARRRADQKAADEQAAREKADAAVEAEKAERRRAQERLVRLNVVTGNFLVDAGDYASALLRYSQAWMLDRHNAAAEPIHRLRLGCVLERYPRLEGVCFHTAAVRQAHFAEKLGRVLTRTDDQAFLWDPYRSRLVAGPLPHEGKVLCAALSPDGTRVVTTSTDGTARLWMTATGEPLGSPLRHPGVVHHAAFSPDGRRLATACADGTVRFWSVPGGELLEPAVRCGGELHYVSFSSVAGLIATADASGTARVWSTADGHPLTPPLRQVQAQYNPQNHTYQGPLFSPDGTRLLTLDERTVHVCEARTGARTMPPYTMAAAITRVAFSPEGTRILLIGKMNGVIILDALKGVPLLHFDTPSENQVGCFSPDGERVAISSQGLIQVRDARTGEQVVTPLQHRTLTELSFNPAGDRLLAAGRDGTARLWVVRFDPFKARPYDHGCGHADHLIVAGRCVSPDGLWEAAPREPTGARLWGLRSGKPGLLLPHPGLVRETVFAPDGRSVLTADDRGVQVWDAETGTPRGPMLPTNGVLVWGQFCADGSRLLLIDAQGDVSVRETASGRTLLGPMLVDAKLATRRGAALGRVAVLSPDGHRLALDFLSSDPKGVRLYEIDTGRSTAVIRHGGPLAMVAFSPDSKRLVSAFAQAGAQVWDVETGEAVGPQLRHPTFVRAAAFGPDGRLVVTHDAYHHARLWDSATGDLLTPPLPTRLGDLADFWFSADGRRLIGAGGGGNIRQWELPVFRTGPNGVFPLVRLLTGFEVDDHDGIAQLDLAVFRDGPEEYRQAWLSWKGVSDVASIPRLLSRWWTP